MITAAEWKQIQKRWFYAQQFEFQVDGDLIGLSLTMLKGGKLAYGIYVNGFLKTDWLHQKSAAPERRYYPKREEYFHSAKDRKDYALRRIMKTRLDGKIVSYAPYWRSFAQFKKHLLCLTHPDGTPSEITYLDPADRDTEGAEA